MQRHWLFIRKFFHRQANQLWYGELNIFYRLLIFLLLPLVGVYKSIIFIKRFYQQIFFTPHKDNQSKIPVIVVGNITVGGTGKTPFVIWLVHFLLNKNYRVGIISRGYGGKSSVYPLHVMPTSDPTIVGDEAVLLARRTECPVVVSPNREAALNYLHKNHTVDVVISDDGLQHYKLKRDIEIVIVDGERMFGNGFCLPAGPLREPLTRLDSVDFVVVNGESYYEFSDKKIYIMRLESDKFYNIVSPELLAVRDDFGGQPVHVVAGIGNPERFFNKLIQQGLSVLSHAFPDHHNYQEQDFDFSFGHKNHSYKDKESKIIMTEKDAIKCEAFADYRYWCLPVTANISNDLGEQILKKLK